MNARKKTLIVFAILLVFLLLYSMNFIQLQDIGDEKNEVFYKIFKKTHILISNTSKRSKLD